MAARLFSNSNATVDWETIPCKAKPVDTLAAMATFRVGNVMLEARRKKKNRGTGIINSSRFAKGFLIGTLNEPDALPF